MQKIFGIGFSKTGTTSLENALELLGYNTWRRHWENPNLSYATALYLYKDYDKLFNIINYYDAFADIPWGGSDLYQALYEHFPNSKFILTTRETESWYLSFEKMITRFDSNLETALDSFHAKGRYGAVHFFKEVFHIETLSGNREKIIEHYNTHNQNVLDFLNGRGADFIVMDISGGDGWDKLCNFLNKPIPRQPFPHANKSPNNLTPDLSRGTSAPGVNATSNTAISATSPKVFGTIRKLKKYLEMLQGFFILRSSDLLDHSWYLSKNPDVAQANVNATFHYLLNGGFEGRDPSPNFSSKWYLDMYEDVRKAGINPLVHYLRYGRKEGRLAYPQNIEAQSVDEPAFPYKCPVCQKGVSDFLPIPDFYMENIRKFGYPYTFDDAETLNADNYSCPHCGASDRDRLYACYMEKKLAWHDYRDKVRLLDIAPSASLSNFIKRFDKIEHITADLLAEGVSFVADITNMPEVASDSYDILICSHVLEHVKDDKKALSELYRVLKPGGWGIIMVPVVLAINQIDEDPDVTEIAERWRRFGQDDHVRLYDKTGFVERLEAAGFLVSQLGVDYFGESTFVKHGIGTKSVLYVVEKQTSTGTKSSFKRDCDFFFIVGTGRSGTTLMAQVLNAHSQVCVPVELQIAFEESNNGARLAEIFKSGMNLMFRAEDYTRLLEERCPNDLARYHDYFDFFNRCPYPILSLQWLLTELYTDIAYSKGKSIFAEQTPWYGQNIKLLDQLFPRAKFIHMVRDGRDVAISFTRTPWWHKDANLNLERWTSEVNKIERDGAPLSNKRMLTIRYEDLVLRPEEVTRSVCNFLGIEFEETMLKTENHIDYSQYSKIPYDNVLTSPAYQKWKAEKKNAFFSENIYGWRSNKQFSFNNVSEATKEMLRHFGYED